MPSAPHRRIYNRRRLLSALFGSVASSLMPRKLWSAFQAAPAPKDATIQPQPLPASKIRFEEIAAKYGLDFVTNNSPTPNKNQIETMVAGVALLDYDGDGFLDIYLVNGAEIPSRKIFAGLLEPPLS